MISHTRRKHCSNGEQSQKEKEKEKEVVVDCRKTQRRRGSDSRANKGKCWQEKEVDQVTRHPRRGKQDLVVSKK